MKISCSQGFLLLMLAVLLCPAMAADKPGKDATRRLQQQLRKADQEKSQLLTEKADVEGKLNEALDKAGAAKTRADSGERRAAQLDKELKTLKAEKDALVAANQTEVETLNRKTADAERRIVEQKSAFEAEKLRLESISKNQLTALNGCSERNARMYKLGNELLDKYEHKSCWDSALQGEPFTGLRRAQIEKMVEENREKLDKDQLLPANHLSGSN
jgi:F0F1-type ATP synthase membrane subunit b/b'